MKINIRSGCVDGVLLIDDRFAPMNDKMLAAVDAP